MAMGEYGGDEELPVYDGEPEDVERAIGENGAQDDMEDDD